MTAYLPMMHRLRRLLADPASDRPADRAALAHLRQGPSTARGIVALAAVLEPALTEMSDAQRDRAYLVAGLFALHASLGARTWNEIQADGVSLGAAYRRLARHEEGGSEPDDATTNRFRTLLASDLEDLERPLRQAVRLLGDKGVALDWAMLASQLDHWRHHDRWVQKRLARDFFTSVSAASASTPV